MEPKIEDGVLIVVDVDTIPKYAKPSYIRAASIDGVRHRDDSTCWIDYGAHMFVARGSAATISALVWPRKAERPPMVMGPWEQDHRNDWVRRFDDISARFAYVYARYDGLGWEVGMEHGCCSTLEEAKAAADAVLTSHGWALS